MTSTEVRSGVPKIKMDGNRCKRFLEREVSPEFHSRLIAMRALKSMETVQIRCKKWCRRSPADLAKASMTIQLFFSLSLFCLDGPMSKRNLGTNCIQF